MSIELYDRHIVDGAPPMNRVPLARRVQVTWLREFDPGAVAYIWHAGTKAGIVQDSLAACGFETRSPQGVAYVPFSDRVIVADAGDGSVRR
jgi:hypothetical protein